MTDFALDAAAATANGGAATRRHVLIRWLRQTHGWIGLWGAALGLLFGFTGIFLNHRSVLKLPGAQAAETSVQVALPDPPPADAAAMATWLQKELSIDRPASRVRSEPARPVPWGDRSVRQPARWMVSFTSATTRVQAEYWVGNGSVGVRRSENSLVGTLTNLHKGEAATVGWVLLVDTLAGSILLLSVTGVLLWMLTRRRRSLGVVVVVVTACLLALGGFAWQAF